MNEQEMMAGSMLTPDEQVLRDFVESRQKKAEEKCSHGKKPIWN